MHDTMHDTLEGGPQRMCGRNTLCRGPDFGSVLLLVYTGPRLWTRSMSCTVAKAREWAVCLCNIHLPFLLSFWLPPHSLSSSIRVPYLRLLVYSEFRSQMPPSEFYPVFCIPFVYWNYPCERLPATTIIFRHSPSRRYVAAAEPRGKSDLKYFDHRRSVIACSTPGF